VVAIEDYLFSLSDLLASFALISRRMAAFPVNPPVGINESCGSVWKTRYETERAINTCIINNRFRRSYLSAHSEHEPEELTGGSVEPILSLDFKEYLLSGPRVDDFEIKRDKDPGREIEF